MIPLALDEIAPLGRLETARGATHVAGVQVDSRRIVPGDLFVAVNQAGAAFVDDAPSVVHLQFNEEVAPWAVKLIDASGQERSDVSLHTQGKAVILTTHHLDEAERLCTRFGLLHRGRLVSEGTLGELRAASGCASLVEMFLKLSQVGPALHADKVTR